MQISAGTCWNAARWFQRVNVCPVGITQGKLRKSIAAQIKKSSRGKLHECANGEMDCEVFSIISEWFAVGLIATIFKKVFSPKRDDFPLFLRIFTNGTVRRCKKYWNKYYNKYRKIKYIRRPKVINHIYANFDDGEGAYVNVSTLIPPASIWRMYHLIRRNVKDLSSKLHSRGL